MCTGVDFEVAISGYFAVQPGLHYTRMGNRSYKHSFIHSPHLVFDETATLHYLQLPVLFKLKLGSEWVKFVPFAGPYLGYTFSGNRQVFSGIVPTTTTDYAINFRPQRKIQTDNDDYTRWDIGLQAGAGLSIKAGRGWFGFDVRYLYGLAQNFQNKQMEQDLDLHDVYNQAVSLGVSYSIPIGEE